VTTTARDTRDRRDLQPRKTRLVLLSVLSTFYMSAGGLVLVLLALVTGLRARDAYGRFASRLSYGLIRLWGVRLEVVGAFPPGQVVYVSNHTSALDVFVICALGLPRTRYFLTGALRLVAPLGLIGWLIGVFFTPPQTRRDERVALFQRATRELAASAESVFLTPEGERICTGEIGHFNRGAFHLALALRAPIVPLFIDTPADTDPGMGLDIRPGTVRVHVKPAVATASRTVTVENVEPLRDEVRAAYVSWNAARRRDNDIGPSPVPD
jgi:1-acyl-sn-glycerol-3-phosphate acyltransferase